VSVHAIAGVAIAVVFLAWWLTGVLAARSRRRILHALLDGRELSGLDLVDAAHVYGSVYIHLGRLEADGCVASRWESSGDAEVMAIRGGRPRRVYSITDRGRDYWYADPRL